ncbi:hypothetical protein [Thiomonas sp.]
MDRKELLAQVTWVGLTTPNRSSRPLFGCIRLAVGRDGHLVVLGTNAEDVAEAHLPCTVPGDDASVAVPKKALLDALKASKGAELVVELDPEPPSGSLTLVDGGSTRRIPGESLLDYSWPSVDWYGEGDEYPAGSVPGAFSMAAVAADPKSPRALLQGVCLCAAGAVASDGWGAIQAPHGVEGIEGDIVLPATAAKAIAGVNPTYMYNTPTHVRFVGPTRLLSVKRLEGKYFSILELVPKTWAGEVTVDGKELLLALKTAVLGQEMPYAVNITRSQSALELSTKEFRAMIPLAGYSGAVPEIAVNGDLVSKLLAALKGRGPVTWCFTTEDKLFQITQEGSSGRAWAMPLQKPNA